MPRFVALLSLFLLTGCLKQELQTGLTEAEALEIIVLLKDHNFEATRASSAGNNQTAETKFSVVFTYRAADNRPLPGSRSASLPDVPL